MKFGIATKVHGRTLMAAFALTAMIVALPGALFAQLSDKETVVTFSAPLEIPGSHPQVLPPGTYRFRVMDTKAVPHIVQISNNDNNRVYSTILATPARREVPTSNTVMTFLERGSGRPNAIQTWFFPHDTIGEEFIYGPPLTIPVVAAAPPPAPVPAPTPQPEVAVSIPPPAPEPAPAPVQQPPQRVEAAPAPPAPAAEIPQPVEAAAPPPEPPQEPAALPQTASNLPLIGLTGLFLVGCSVLLRCLRLGR